MCHAVRRSHTRRVLSTRVLHGRPGSTVSIYDTGSAATTLRAQTLRLRLLAVPAVNNDAREVFALQNRSRMRPLAAPCHRQTRHDCTPWCQCCRFCRHDASAAHAVAAACMGGKDSSWNCSDLDQHRLVHGASEPQGLR
eukprot:SAG31_NODE_245_length_19224_cov_10.210614_9_plen_139_part_00